MSPEIQRSDPPYVQVVRSIRARIESGELRDGDMVPSTRQISKDWGISHATATKVLAALRSEGLARGVPGVGTVVTAAAAARSARDRMATIRRTGRIYPPGEHAKIISAEVVTSSAQVADALGIEPGRPAVRRHRVTYRGDDPVSASTSWFDGALAGVAPRLLEAGRLEQGTPGYVAEMTGRTITSGRDQNAADAATEQDARDIGVPVGSPVLRGRNWVYDADGDVIEYGEYISAAGRWSSYYYEIAN